MKKFMLIYHAPRSFSEQMANVSPEDAKKHMQPWMDWMKKCGSNMVDMGTPLGNAHKVSSGDHGSSDSNIAGFSILQGASMEDIKPLVINHPHIQSGEGCTVEIFEMLPVPGM